MYRHTQKFKHGITQNCYNKVEGAWEDPFASQKRTFLGLGHQVCDFQEKYLQKVTVKCFLTLKVSMAYLEY